MGSSGFDFQWKWEALGFLIVWCTVNLSRWFMAKWTENFLNFRKFPLNSHSKWLVWSTINHFDLCNIFIVLKSFMFKLPCLFWNAVGYRTEKINYSVCSWIDTNTWNKEHYTIVINPHVLSLSPFHVSQNYKKYWQRNRNQDILMMFFLA